MICQKCNSILPDDSIFCQCCGTPLKDTIAEDSFVPNSLPNDKINFLSQTDKIQKTNFKFSKNQKLEKLKRFKSQIKHNFTPLILVVIILAIVISTIFQCFIFKEMAYDLEHSITSLEYEIEDLESEIEDLQYEIEDLQYEIEDLQ